MTTASFPAVSSAFAPAPPMRPDSRIYVAGHRGLVGGALMRALTEQGFRPHLVENGA